jgi:hypothetical protein
MSTDGVKDSMSAAVLEKHQEVIVKLVIVEFGRIIPSPRYIGWMRMMGSPPGTRRFQ